MAKTKLLRNEFHGVPGVVVELKSGGTYTRTEEGQIRRVDRNYRSKKERNRDKKLKRAAGL
jgi:hypothetical protein